MVGGPGGMVMGVPVLEHVGADHVDDEPDHGHGDGFVEADALGGDQPLHGFNGHDQCDYGQHHGAGEAAEFPHLARAEAETRVVGMPAREIIGQGGDPQGHGVRAHVPPVRQKRHGAEGDSGGDFDHHHSQGEHHHPAGGALAVAVLQVEAVVVLPAVQRMNMHIRLA